MATVTIVQQTYPHKMLKDGTFPIYARINIGTKQTYKALKISVPKEHFDASSGMVNKKNSNYLIYNKKIGALLEELQSSLKELELRDEVFTAQDILTKKNSDANAEFKKFCLNQMKRYANLGTFRVKQARFNKLIAFDPKITWRSITPNFIRDYEAYLISIGNDTNTITGAMRYLSQIIREARGEKIIAYDYDPFANIRLKSKKTRKVGLSMAQVEAIRKVNTLPGTSLDDAKNVFLFAFNTFGTRIGDICRFTTANIKNGFLIYTMSKTDDDYFEIKLTEEATTIIEKYRRPNQHYLFPLIQERYDEKRIFNEVSAAEARINKALKTLAALAEIDVALTTHVARRTWAQQAKRMSGGNMRLVQFGLGHETMRTTEIYTGNENFEEINELNKKITG